MADSSSSEGHLRSQLSSHCLYREDPRRFGRRFDRGIDLRILMDSHASELGGLYGKQLSAPTAISCVADDDEPRREVSPARSSPAPREAGNPPWKAGKAEGSHALPPGENNPNSNPSMHLCFDYLNKG